MSDVDYLPKLHGQRCEMSLPITTQQQEADLRPPGDSLDFLKCKTAKDINSGNLGLSNLRNNG